MAHTPLFNPRLIPKCHDRLDKSKQALYECRNAKTADEFRSKWSSFLINSGSVLNALNTGANHTPQARQWYGGVKRAGRADSLVSYMHQARNVEEHGADQTAYAYNGLPFGMKDMETGEIDWWSDDYVPDSRPKEFVVGFGPPGPQLRAVRDTRFNTSFLPPEKHAGKKLKSTDPISVGKIYMDYLEKLVSEAESLSQ